MKSRAAFRATVELAEVDYASHSFISSLTEKHDLQLRKKPGVCTFVRNFGFKQYYSMRTELSKFFSLCRTHDIPVFIYIHDYQEYRISMDAFQFTREGQPAIFTSGLGGIFSSSEKEDPLCIDWTHILRYREVYKTLQLLKGDS